ncbi:unnamed protein product, partial [Phaeothamnion confervicola]
DGNLVSAGCYWTTKVYAGTHYRLLEGGGHAAFNDARGSIHLLQLAADLYFDTTTIHPFQDGNGHLFRLLVSYAFMCCDTPSPVILTNGHSRAAKH